MMKSVRSEIIGDSSIFNLKQINSSQIRKDVIDLLLPNEDIVGAFKTIRDQVVFTDRRIIVVNVQGIGKKVSYTSFPYSKVLYFGIQTAGVIDIDSEMTLSFADGTTLHFDFTLQTNVHEICRALSARIL